MVESQPSKLLVAGPIPVSRSISSLPLHSQRHRIPTAQAQSSHAFVDVAMDHRVDQCDQDSGPAGADGMADGYRSAIHVDLIKIEAEFLADP